MFKPKLSTYFDSYTQGFTQSYPQKDITDYLGFDSGEKWRKVVWVTE